MNRQLITREIIVILPVLLVLTGLGCSSPVGTWTVDVKKTVDSVETIPEGFQDKHENLESYKEWLAGEIEGFELTFTTERMRLYGWLFEEVFAVIYEVRYKRGDDTHKMYWMDDDKYSLVYYERGTRSTGPMLFPQGHFIVSGDSAVWQKMKLVPVGYWRWLEVPVHFKRKSFWSRGLTFYQKLIVGITIWSIAHLALFVIGFASAKPSLLGRWARWPGVVSQLASWVLTACIVVFGFTCIRAIFWQPRPVLVWTFVILSPLCCFATGLAYGLTHKRTRLLPLALLVLGVGMTLVALLKSFLDGFLI